MNAIPDGVEVDVNIYMIPTGPGSFSDGMVMKLGSVNRVPEFGSSEWRNHIAKIIADIDTMPGVGPVRLMSKAEIKDYKVRQEEDKTWIENDELGDEF